MHLFSRKVTIYEDHKTNLFFIRHAESQYEHWKRRSFFRKLVCSNSTTYRGKNDPPLTTRGVNECRKLKSKVECKRFKLDKDVDIIYVPPTIRCLETLEKVFPHVDPSKVRIENLIRDRVEHKADEGTHPSVLKSKFPKYDFSHLNEDFWLDHAKRGEFNNVSILVKIGEIALEPIEKFGKRVKTFIRKLRNEDRGKNIVIIGHAQFYKQMLMLTSGHVGMRTPGLGHLISLNPGEIMEGQMKRLSFDSEIGLTK